MTTMQLTSEPKSQRSKWSHLRTLWDNAGMLLVFAALFIGSSIWVPNFFSQFNIITGLSQSVATIGIVGCTMLFCLAAGDFDLSVGSVAALSGVIATIVANRTGNAVLGLGAGVLAGGVVGLFNGLVIAKLGVNALIATLASMQMVRGLAYLVAPEHLSVGISSKSGLSNLGVSNTPPVNIGSFHMHGIPTPVLIMIGCFIIFGLLLNKTTFGRNTLAVGGNAEAARLAGVAVVRTKVIIFTMQGIMAGFAGVILASLISLAETSAGIGLELKVISACVLGGVSLTGGIGSITAVIVGVFIMGTVENTMNLMNINNYYQMVLSGAILLAAVLIDRLKTRQ